MRKVLEIIIGYKVEWLIRTKINILLTYCQEPGSGLRTSQSLLCLNKANWGNMLMCYLHFLVFDMVIGHFPSGIDHGTISALPLKHPFNSKAVLAWGAF